MHKSNGAVFSIPVGNGDYVVYAPLHGVAALLNASALRKLFGGSSIDAGDTALHALQEALSAEVQPPERRKGAVNAGFLGLVTTRACNLSCAYCGFGAGSAPGKRMPPETVIAAIDWMVQNAIDNGKDVVEVHFFGGEPFVAWDIVELAVHRTRRLASKHGLKTHFEASTNGVLTEKKARFVGDYFNAVVLSLDGFQQYHDRNRAVHKDKGSFDAVVRTAEIWSDMQVDLCLRTCITDDSVHDMVAITQWYCENFQPEVINFETLQAWPKTLEEGLYPPDPEAFASGFLRARNLAAGYGIPVVYAADWGAEPRHSFCPVGKDTIIVTPDNRINGCYLMEQDWEVRGLNLNIGTVQSGRLQLDMDQMEQLRTLVTLKPACSDCFCKWTCAGGCHVNHSYPGAILEPDFCAQTRLITLCSILEQLGYPDRVEALLQTPDLSKHLSDNI